MTARDPAFEAHVASVKALLVTRAGFPLATVNPAPDTRFVLLAGAVASSGEPVFARQVAVTTSRRVIRQVLEAELRRNLDPLPQAMRLVSPSGVVFYKRHFPSND